MSSQYTNLSSRLFDNISFIRSKSIVTTNCKYKYKCKCKINCYCHFPQTHCAIRGLWHWHLISKFWNSFFCFCNNFLFVAVSFAFTGTVSFIFCSSCFWLLFYFKTFKLSGEWGGLPVRAKPHEPCISYMYKKGRNREHFRTK